jgi:hypothetical protein
MESHDETADKLEEQADRMEEVSGELKQEIADQREDWDSKTKAESVPGAHPVPEPGAEPPAGHEEDESGHGAVEVEETENRP